MTDIRRATVSWILMGVFCSPGLALAQYDGVWTGEAIPNAGTPADCEGGDIVIVVEGNDVRGGAFGFDEVAQELDEEYVAGTIDAGGNINNGTVTDSSLQVTATFTGSFFDTNLNVSFQSTEDQNCAGTASLTQRASYLFGYDELWVGTAAESASALCPGADPIADVILAISGSQVAGSIEITQAGEAPVTFLAIGSVNASRVLVGGSIQTSPFLEVATMSGTFGAQNTVLNWSDGECTGTITLALDSVGNTPPTASPLAFDVVAGRTFSGVLPAQDPDPGTTLTYAIVTQPTKGSVVIDDQATGAFTYTADRSESGADSFEFRVNDGAADSNTAVVSVTIEPSSNVLSGLLRLILIDD